VGVEVKRLVFQAPAMMAPEQVEAAAADSAPASSGLGDAPRPGTEKPEGRAPLRWPYRTHVQQEQAERHAPAVAKSETSPETSEESEGERSNPSDGRDNGEEINSDSGAPMLTPPSSAQGDQPAEQEHASGEGDGAVTADVIASRHAMMFAVGAAEPAESGLPASATTPTNQLVVLVWAHMQGLPQDHIDALSKAFGNFDRVVAAGWLLADLVRGSPNPRLWRAGRHRLLRRQAGMLSIWEPRT
jgi:hypothetical protein